MSVEQAIHARLTGDAALVALCTGGIWQGSPRQGEDVPPYLKWQLLGSPPTEYTLVQKVADDLMAQLYAWAEDGDNAEGVATARGIIDRAEVVLADAPLTVSGRTLLFCRKDMDLPDLEDVLSGGVVRYGKGQQWRIVVS